MSGRAQTGGVALLLGNRDEVGGACALAVWRALGVNYMYPVDPATSPDDIVELLHTTRASCVLVTAAAAAAASTGLQCVPVYRLPDANTPFATTLLSLLSQRLHACAA